MNEPARTVTPDEVEAAVRERGIELLRSNETLRDELQQLRLENAKLATQLADAERARRADRQSRQAALNLMEDAVAARQAEQRENAERKRVEQELRNADRRKDAVIYF